MKKVLLSIILTIFLVSGAFACDFEFSTKDKLKSVKAGDEIIVNVVLNLTHRACETAAKETKFKFDGMKIVSATDWKQDSPLSFSRQIKAKVNKDGKKKILLTATRACSKDGGRGVFTLPKK